MLGGGRGRRGHGVKIREGGPRFAFHRVLCVIQDRDTHPLSAQGDREATRTRSRESAGQAVIAALTPWLELGAEPALPCGRLPRGQAW